MSLKWSNQAWEDYLHWQVFDPITFARINAMIKEINQTPFDGTGNPEPLRYNLAGYWSRRIDRVNRLVYKTDAQNVYIAQLRYNS